MAYCTNAELILLTDSTIDTDNLDAIIAQADREIEARILAAGITPPASDDMLKAASLNLSTAGIITFNRMKTKLTDRSQAKSVRFGDTTISDDPDKAIEVLTEKAWQSVDGYIAIQSSTATSGVPLPRSTTS